MAPDSMLQVIDLLIHPDVIVLNIICTIIQALIIFDKPGMYRE